MNSDQNNRTNRDQEKVNPTTAAANDQADHLGHVRQENARSASRRDEDIARKKPTTDSKRPPVPRDPG
jgi:hypothetical protein